MSERLALISREIDSASAEILATTRAQAAAATEQATSIGDITTTVDELNEVAVQNV